MTDRTENEIHRGEQAARLLNEPLMIEAFATIEQEYTQKWLDSPERDVEGRERLRMMIKQLHKLQLELVKVMETGQIAQATLAQRIGQTLNPFS